MPGANSYEILLMDAPTAPPSYFSIINAGLNAHLHIEVDLVDVLSPTFASHKTTATCSLLQGHSYMFTATRLQLHVHCYKTTALTQFQYLKTVFFFF